MSFAKPPTYRLRKGAGQGKVPKPAGPAAPTVPPFTYGWGGQKKVNPKIPFYNPKPKAAGAGGSTGALPPVTAAPPPVNAPAQNAPITPPTPPPETLQGGLERGGATDQYNLGIPDINHQLWEAAFNYGGVPQVQQAGYELDPATGKYRDTSSMVDVGANPNSKVSQIARGLTADTSTLSNNLNNANSYFSGAHVEGQGKLDDQAGRDRLQAQQDFQDSMLRLTTLLGQARHDRDVGLGAADVTDLNAAVAVPPEDRQPGTNADGAVPAGGLAGNPPPPLSPSRGPSNRRAPHGGGTNKTLSVRRGAAMGQIKTPSNNTGLLKKKRK